MADADPPPAPPAGGPSAVAARLRAGAARLGVQLGEAAVARLLAFASELLRWNARVDLIGPADLETVAARHLLDSLAPLPVLRGAGVRRLADIGSGAGLPGLALAIAEPALHVVSIEPRARRAAFQRHVIRRLALDNAVVVAARVAGVAGPGGRGPAAAPGGGEGGSPREPGGRALRREKRAGGARTASTPIPGAPFDAVLGRALAALPDFLALAAPLARPGGLVVAMRGRLGDEEAAAAAAHAGRLGLTLERRLEYPLPAAPRREGGARTRLLLVYRAGGADQTAASPAR